MTKALNWDCLVTIFDNHLFILSEKHWKSIITAIKEHNRYRALKHFKNLPDKFENSFCRKLTGKNDIYIAGWLRDRAKENMVKRVGFGKWLMLKRGKEVREFLERLHLG